MLYLLIASFMWGSSFIAIKIAYTTIDPVLVVLCRLVLAAVITIPVSYRYLKQQNTLTKKRILQLLLWVC